MTSQERFEHIERTLALTVEAQRVQAEYQTRVYESHLKLQDTVIELTRTVSGYMDVVSRYVDAADVRMKRIEENLDGLIRAITAEHSNGKARQK
jgi:hypothetical protein